MCKERFVISDRSWSIVEPLMPGVVRDSGVTAKDTRLFLEAVLWRVRVGGPWRDLPTRFGEWNSIFQRFRRWAQADVFQRIFEAVSGDPTLSIPSLMEQLSACFKRQAAQKGDSQSGHWVFKRRINNQGLGSYCCLG